MLAYIEALTIPFTAEDFELVILSNYSFDRLWIETVLNRPRLRPMAYLQWWGSSHLFGADPLGYRLFSLGMHTISTLAVAWLGWLLSHNRRIALAAGILFALYPRHHEPVIWMAANNTTQAGMLALLGICSFIMYHRSRKQYWLVASILSLAIGMFANELAVIAIGLIGLIDLFILRRPILQQSLRDPRLYITQAPYVLLIFCYGLVTFWGERISKLGHQAASSELIGESYRLTLPTSTMIKDFAAYMTYALIPYIPLRSLDPGLITMGVAALCCGVLVLLFARGGRLVRLLVAWIILSVIPFLLFVPFGNADRYFYLSAAGLAILVAILASQAYRWLLQRIGMPRTQWLGYLLLASYIVASLINIQQRIIEWRGAGEQIEAITAQVVQLAPDLKSTDPVLFVGLPERNGQAFVLLGGGISGALAVAYNQPAFFTTYESFDPELKQQLLSAAPVETPQQKYRIFVFDQGQIIEKTNSVADIEALSPNEWLFRVYETGRDIR
ncbi:MAG: hypothetical protein OHK0050_05050 [Roseiflexaceae bacterium]